MSASGNFLPLFEAFDIEVDDGVRIHGKCAGAGPAVLLLHGYPQSHVTWHEVAPSLLAAGYRVVMTDLRGYGDSSRPAGGTRHVSYSKRRMALDQVQVMRHLGMPRFSVIGHDRGGRVAHRLALDHRDALQSVAVLDIAPTATMLARTDEKFARRYFWWFFLIQPFPLPERLIEAELEFFLRHQLLTQSRTPGIPREDLVQEYLRCYRQPDSIHAVCEDYRAAASIDLEHDAADAEQRVAAPLLALWGTRGVVGETYDVLATWREKALDVHGRGVDCGHLLQEEVPDEIAAALVAFLRAHVH